MVAYFLSGKKSNRLCLLAPPKQQWTGWWWKRAGRIWAIWYKLVTSSEQGSSALGRMGQVGPICLISHRLAEVLGLSSQQNQPPEPLCKWMWQVLICRDVWSWAGWKLGLCSARSWLNTNTVSFGRLLKWACFYLSCSILRHTSGENTQ